MTRRASATDDSPVYSTGRGTAATDALFGDLNAVEERRYETRAELTKQHDAAFAAWWAFDQDTASSLYRELAAAWRAAGFEDEAASCESMARQPREVSKPQAPKTLSRSRGGKR